MVYRILDSTRDEIQSDTILQIAIKPIRNTNRIVIKTIQIIRPVLTQTTCQTTFRYPPRQIATK